MLSLTTLHLGVLLGRQHGAFGEKGNVNGFPRAGHHQRI